MALAAAWAFRHLGMTAQELLQDGIRRFVPFKVAAKGTEPSADYSPTLKSAFILTILLGFLFVPQAHADLTTGLVGYWSFDDGTGTQAADFPGRGTPLYGSTRLRGLHHHSGPPHLGGLFCADAISMTCEWSRDCANQRSRGNHGSKPLRDPSTTARAHREKC